MKKMLALAITLTALTFTTAAFAKSKTMTFTVYTPTTVGGTQLKPGEYQVKIADGVVTFSHDGKEIARAAVHETMAAQKFDSTEFLSDASHVLTEIHIGGTMEDAIIDGPAK